MRQKLGTLKVLRRGLKTSDQEKTGSIRSSCCCSRIFSVRKHVFSSFPRSAPADGRVGALPTFPLRCPSLQPGRGRGCSQQDLSQPRGGLAQEFWGGGSRALLPEHGPPVQERGARGVPARVARGRGLAAPRSRCHLCSGRIVSPHRAIPISHWHGTLFSAYFLKSLLIASLVGAFRFTKKKNPTG